MADIKLDKITKDYGKHKGVFDLDLQIKSGEFFVILGPSGCGKTTTLRIIAGLETPDSGRVYLDDVDITDYPPKDRNMSMVFQNYALYPFMSARDNIAFPLKKKKMSKQDINRKVEEIAETLSISDILDKKPGQLSGGQRQRVALARAIVKEPKVFLMDEPLSNLDAKLRISMRAELKNIQRKLGITTVYVTHDQIEAMTLADRTAILDGGKLVQLDSPLKIYEQPATIFVAGFMGDPPINFIDVEIENSGEQSIIHVGSQSFTLSGNIPVKKAVLGIRPEDVRVSEKGLKAKLYFEQVLGSRYIQHFKLDGLDKDVLSVSTHAQYKDGEQYYITFTEGKIFLFDKETGKRIL